jgi:hypothetical protein
LNLSTRHIVGVTITNGPFPDPEIQTETLPKSDTKSRLLKLDGYFRVEILHRRNLALRQQFRRNRIVGPFLIPDHR